MEEYEVQDTFNELDVREEIEVEDGGDEDETPNNDSTKGE